ncbi:Pyroglutamyl-peptidase I [Pirellula staleyi DSM 6068]|uniref:Pyrrolidone-carboxylate peptidase n=1 Tax=Pirellula staleyi (strain ATCC 27377 / DSM 6068 / ICPB 4128) TaxID=530564 RepID=D2R2Q4_PIRSD|nr:pyroglutamyl-peptidase I [Pirellula staleyi]ADB16894.1 Pyroglutamyl-peptidase I [Pirellula staleyi DSM 6068]
MKRVLITAFEPYDRWPENSSWLALVELTRELPERPQIVTRRYPVHFEKAKTKLFEDLSTGFDYTIHLGQAPGTSRVQLEAVGLNVGGNSGQRPDEFRVLVENAPVAYRTNLPLGSWSEKIRELGIPCQVSYHAGTYLCNAMLYLSQHFARQNNWATKSVFVHLPLAPKQVLLERQDVPTLKTEDAARAIREILKMIDDAEPMLA